MPEPLFASRPSADIDPSAEINDGSSTVDSPFAGRNPAPEGSGRAASEYSEVREARRAALRATHLYVCTTAREDRGDLAEFVDAAFRGGVGIVQLRDKGMEAAAEIERLRIVAEAARRHGGLVSVNDRADVAALVGAEVFHVGQGDLSTEQARSLLGEDVLVGRSTHSVEQIDAANADPGLDYFCVGPVWETPTKPGRAAVGTGLLEYAVSVAVKPWFAIGGIDAGERLDAVVAAGAERIVVVRAVTGARDPEAAAQELLTRLG